MSVMQMSWGSPPPPCPIHGYLHVPCPIHGSLVCTSAGPNRHQLRPLTLPQYSVGIKASKIHRDIQNSCTLPCLCLGCHPLSLSMSLSTPFSLSLSFLQAP